MQIFLFYLQIKLLSKLKNISLLELSLTQNNSSVFKLYTFPLGYWLPMQELSGSFLFRSQGKRLGVSLQTETLKEHWSLFHDLFYETQQFGKPCDQHRGDDGDDHSQNGAQNAALLCQR